MRVEDVLEGAHVVALVLLLAAACLAVWRLVRGPDLANRVVALDLLAIVVVALIGLHTLRTGAAEHVLMAIVVALIAFLGTVAFAGYVAGRRPR